MNAIEFLIKRRAELESARQESAARLNMIVGGIAEIDYAIEQLKPPAGSPVVHPGVPWVVPASFINLPDGELQPALSAAFAEHIKDRMSKGEI